MFELFRTASDDHLALFGCAAALIVSAGLMYVSYYLGEWVRKPRRSAPATPQLEQTWPRDKAA